MISRDSTQPQLQFPFYIGVDVSKKQLDVSSNSLGFQHFQVPNKQAGIAKLINRLLKAAAHSQLCVVLEHTGGYELGLRQALENARICCAVPNPRCVRDFARATGRLAKTDRLDAIVLADFGSRVNPPPSALLSKAQIQLQEATRQRIQLLHLLQARKNTQEHLTINALKTDNLRLIKQLEQHVHTLEAIINKLIEDSQGLKALLLGLCSIQGIAATSAALILAELPEIGTLARAKASSLAGLAPFNRDSGAFQGRRFIGGGRGALRRALYMPALVATQHNTHLRAYYLQLLQLGKPKKVAITALMRKLLIHANSIAKSIRSHPDFTF